MNDPNAFRRIGVFCGSHFGANPAYRQAAEAFAGLLLERDLGLVYGGGNVGLMGVLADTMMAGGGEVIGVIPRSLFEREVAHQGITDLQIVDGMHERKRRIYEASDALVALPGGIGTFDELFEGFTWNQLAIHFKPTGLLNVDGYYDALVTQLDLAAEQGFVRRQQRDWLVVGEEGPELLRRLEAVRPSNIDQWLPKVSA